MTPRTTADPGAAGGEALHDGLGDSAGLADRLRRKGLRSMHKPTRRLLSDASAALVRLEDDVVQERERADATERTLRLIADQADHGRMKAATSRESERAFTLIAESARAALARQNTEGGSDART